MRKNLFIIIALLVSTSLIPMESALVPKEKQKFVVSLYVTEVTQETMKESWNSTFDNDDEHACKVLGIPWEKNNNRYFTNRALIKRFGEAKYSDCWRKNIMFDLTTIIPYDVYPEKLRYLIKFPGSLPATFVERLEKEKSITLENTLFAEPVEIIIELGKLITQSKESSSSES
jgi:hypothetical protein